MSPCGVGIWSGSILKFTWKEFKNPKNISLQSLCKLSEQTPYTLLLLRTWRLPICIMAMKEFTCFIKILKLLFTQEKMIQKSHKSKNLCSNLWKIWKHGLDDETQYNVSWHGENVEAHASRIILHVLHLITKPCFFTNKATIHINTCQNPSPCLPLQPLLPCNLAHTPFDVRQDVWAYVVKVIDYAHFCPKRTQEFWVSHFDTMLCDHIQQYFHTSTTKPNCYTNSLDPSVHSRFWHSLVNFLNIESHYANFDHFLPFLVS